jgi:hypothetical protein
MAFFDHSNVGLGGPDESDEGEMTAPPSCGEARTVDLCEWIDFGTHCTTGCNVTVPGDAGMDIDEFEYCPYCGGNIDLVEAEM